MFKFTIEESPMSGKVNFYFRSVDGNLRGVGLPVAMELQQFVQVKQMLPTISIEEDEAKPMLQSMLDQLWKLGYRPKDIGTAGHLAATQAHLADFRALVSKTLKIPLP